MSQTFDQIKAKLDSANAALTVIAADVAALKKAPAEGGLSAEETAQVSTGIDGIVQAATDIHTAATA